MGVSYPPKIDLQLDAAGACLRAMNIERVEDSKTTIQKEVSPEIQAQQERSKDRVETLPTESLVLTAEEEAAESTISLVEPLEAAFASDELAQEIYKEHCKEEQEKNLFAGFRFFLSREVPQSCLEVVIRSFGGQVGWDGEGSPYSDVNDLVTHHIMDRPTTGHRYFNREYIQPQWIFDCCNATVLLPVEKYAPGCALPPHLSPFVDDEKEGYVPEYRQKIDKLKSARDVLQIENDQEEHTSPYLHGTEQESSSDESSTNGNNGKRSLSPEPTATSKKARQQKDDQEMKELAKTMMSKKAKRLYDRMQYGLNKKSTKAATLQAKADALKTKQ